MLALIIAGIVLIPYFTLNVYILLIAATNFLCVRWSMLPFSWLWKERTKLSHLKTKCVHCSRLLFSCHRWIYWTLQILCGTPNARNVLLLLHFYD